MTMNAPRKGQIWREVDPRFVRYIKILSVTEGRRGVGIRTVDKDVEGNWSFVSGSRSTYADHERFNGKRGGYELIEDRRL
jgi:hypothetical protein